MLLKAGFEERCKDIKLSERGSGFWAWKPFIIQRKLAEAPIGDIVLYCDVGRSYPFKMLENPVTPYLRWMEENGQDLMPGVEIPWDGPNSSWTKRETLVTLAMDYPEVHFASPVQASFSLWRSSPVSREFVTRWMEWCSQRQLISDDPSRGGLDELPGFRGHRHDQALLSLCCIAEGVVGLRLGEKKPAIDVRHPSEVSHLYFGTGAEGSPVAGGLLKAAVWPVWHLEKWLRGKVKFGEPIHE